MIEEYIEKGPRSEFPWFVNFARECGAMCHRHVVRLREKPEHDEERRKYWRFWSDMSAKFYAEAAMVHDDLRRTA